MTDAEQREAARQFVNRWMGKGKEDEDGRSYWIDLLTNVLGMDNVTERLNFEKKVVIDGNTKRIDVYIPETRVIIEQKEKISWSYLTNTRSFGLLLLVCPPYLIQTPLPPHYRRFKLQPPSLTHRPVPPGSSSQILINLYSMK